MRIEPFKINIPDSDIADLKERLRRTRWAAEIEGMGWRQGTDPTYLKELCAYWANAYDWRAQEASLNRFPHFCADVDGLGVHFIHERGRGPKPMPIIISHG